jgi:MraZ protein
MPAEQNPAPIFSGEFCHALDGKNRITIPSRWRAGDADEFFLMADRTGTFLRAMPPDEFRAVGEKLADNPQITAKDRAVFMRQFYSRSRQAIADKQGRLVVPEELCQQLNLRGEIYLVGAHDTFELWSREAWQATKQVEAATFDRVADLIGL